LIGGDRRPRAWKSEGMRIVAEAPRVGERIEQPCRIRNPAPGRVRLGEIDDRLGGRAELSEAFRDGIGVRMRRQAA
jgi:hypothetical protein